MSSATKWFIDNPVAANLLMIFILIAGFLSISSLRIESFPQLPPTQLTVTVYYPGGTAKQVDAGITQRIENAIKGVSGIKSVVSTSRPEYALVRIRKASGVDIERLIEDVRDRVEGINQFPIRAERPKVQREEFTNLAAFVLVYGGENQQALQNVANKVKNALQANSNISQIANLGKLKQELRIEPSPEKLKSYGLDTTELAEIIARWSTEYRTGELKSGTGDITLRGDGFADNLLKLKSLPIISTESTTVTLGEIASISRTYEDEDNLVRFQGEPAIALMVSTSTKDNLLRVSKAIDKELKDIQPSLPSGIKTDIMADMAPYIQNQLGMLSSNAIQGLIIVVIILGIFLEVKLALWVAMGIPISLSGALWLMGMPNIDYSINDITLFGMILVLGVLVDDAIVVGESIHQARQIHTDPKKAALAGVNSVAVATVFGVLTTIAAFSPMLWIENELAKVLAGFSAVVIFALIFSLIESKFILPSHLAFAPSHRNEHFLGRWLKAMRALLNKGLDGFCLRYYEPALRASLNNAFTVLISLTLIMITAYSALIHNQIRSAFFPEIPGRYGTLVIKMDKSASYELSKENVTFLEQATRMASLELQESYNLVQNPFSKYLVSLDSPKRTEVTIELTELALSIIPSDDILRVWQKHIGNIEGASSVDYSLSSEAAGSSSVVISSADRDLAIHVLEKVKNELSSIQGVYNVLDNNSSGKKQLQITLNERGKQLGIEQINIARLVGSTYGKVELHRLLEKGEEVAVVIKIPSEERKSISQLRSTPVQINDNTYVTLGDVADLEFTQQLEVINRRNNDEVIRVSWRQVQSVTSAEEVFKHLNMSVIPEMKRMYPDVKIAKAGALAEQDEVQHGFQKAMMLTLILIYILLAIPLKSYWQPLIIMSVIPFGFAGAIYGHGIMGLPVSLLSMFGMMAMTGVVINDSLVLLTRFNQLYESGMEVVDAIIEACKSRMRAIFLTTLTTICGLLPLLSETSEQAQYLKPAAVSLVFGELFATPITLILIPIILKFGRYKREPILVSQ